MKGDSIMPDFWSHIISGDMLINQLNNKKLVQKIKQNKTLFNLSCQGPDFFYYHNIWPWNKEKSAAELATIFHEKNSNALMLNTLTFLKENYTPKLDIYLSGLFLHYFIDKTTHPLIFSMQKRGYEHKVLEINLDVYAVKNFYQTEAFKLAPQKKINLAEIPIIIQKYYQYIFRAIYGEKNFKTEILDKSFLDFKKVLTLFYSPFKIKSSCFKLLNLILPLNLAKGIYPNSLNHKIISANEYQKFYELLEQGVIEAINFLQLKNNYLTNDLADEIIKEKINNINFNGQIAK